MSAEASPRAPRSDVRPNRARSAAAALLVAATAACSPIRVPDTTAVEPLPTTSAVPPTQAPTTVPASTVPPPASAPVTAPAATTTTAPLYTAAFTGLGTSEEIVRPAAVVKIDNHPKALPQWGLNQADVVYEELVEARLTRFAAIFHSTDAAVVGPVRSARTGDFALLSNLNRPLYVNSGANAYTARALRRIDAVNITDGGVFGKGVFERSSEKHAPHNLITDTDRIYAAAASEGRTPPPYLLFGAADDTVPGAVPISGVDIDFGQIMASYRWDAALSGWARTQNGIEHTDFDGVRVAPANVIVQFVRYRQSPANRATPEPVLTGTGEAWILSNGKVVQGTWERLSELDLTVFRAENAVIVPLTPGRTWIALAPTGSAELVP